MFSLKLLPFKLYIVRHTAAFTSAVAECHSVQQQLTYSQYKLQNANEYQIGLVSKAVRRNMFISLINDKCHIRAHHDHNDTTDDAFIMARFEVSNLVLAR